MNKILVFTLLLAAWQLGSKAQGSGHGEIIFSGVADKAFDGEYVHIYNNNLHEPHDSVMVANGRFEIKRSFSQPTIYRFFSSFEIKKHHGYVPLGIVIDRPCVVKINADMDRLANSSISGSPVNDTFQSYITGLSATDLRLFAPIKAAFPQFAETRRPDTTLAGYREYREQFQRYRDSYKKADSIGVADFVKKHPNSFASVLLLYQKEKFFDGQTIAELFDLLPTAMKKGYYGQDIDNYISGLQSARIGNKVANFSLQDPNGKLLAFRSIKAKYLLIDFWGSWCVPCHVAFKELRPLYQQYHGKGFEILGIASERSQDKTFWLNDIKKEKLPWLQMLDENNGKSVSQRQFAVVQYPTTVLVDASGKIIGRDLPVAEIEKILAGNL